MASSVLVRTATVPAAASCDTNTPAPQDVLAPTDAAAPTGATPANAAPVDAAALLPATSPVTWQLDVYSILQRVAAHPDFADDIQPLQQLSFYLLQHMPEDEALAAATAPSPVEAGIQRIAADMARTRHDERRHLAL